MVTKVCYGSTLSNFFDLWLLANSVNSFCNFYNNWLFSNILEIQCFFSLSIYCEYCDFLIVSKYIFFLPFTLFYSINLWCSSLFWFWACYYCYLIFSINYFFYRLKVFLTLLSFSFFLSVIETCLIACSALSWFALIIFYFFSSLSISLFVYYMVALITFLSMTACSRKDLILFSKPSFKFCLYFFSRRRILPWSYCSLKSVFYFLAKSGL